VSKKPQRDVRLIPSSRDVSVEQSGGEDESSSVEDDEDEEEEEEDEEAPPIPTDRPRDPVMGLKWDAIKLLWRPTDARIRDSEILNVTEGFFNLIKAIDELPKRELIKADGKKTEEESALASRSKQALIETVLGFGHGEIVAWYVPPSLLRCFGVLFHSFSLPFESGSPSATPQKVDLLHRRTIRRSPKMAISSKTILQTKMCRSPPVERNYIFLRRERERCCTFFR
jgi:hypothetical protein